MIGPFFTDIAKVDLQEHLPVITDFWESIIFGTVRYTGNVVLKHVAIDKMKPMEAAHFDRWLELFSETLHEHHSGEKTEEIIQRAKLIASTMGYKLRSLREQ